MTNEIKFIENINININNDDDDEIEENKNDINFIKKKYEELNKKIENKKNNKLNLIKNEDNNINEIQFIENNDENFLEIKMIMNYLLDNVYNKMIDYYKENNINDVILIDRRLDFYREILKKYNYLEYIEDIEVNNLDYKIIAFSKTNLYKFTGLFENIDENYVYIKIRNINYKFDLTKYYIFFSEKMTKEEENNYKFRNLLNDIINNKIRIKVKKKLKKN